MIGEMQALQGPHATLIRLETVVGHDPELESFLGTNAPPLQQNYLR